ncbi:iron-sulfur cluster transfer protein NUBPL [Euwallacea similis]|uniref:iron-sulfur cluster transfer protein NUBPL n=1 Tax=Euwallacea similis TaxID=1736056 RepID=UPI00344D251F
MLVNKLNFTLETKLRKTLPIIFKLLSSEVNSHRETLMKRGLPKQKPIDGVKTIILVSSGKGGVGKSTIASNIAAGIKLIHPEKHVGLLDADIFGPSIPSMMNLHDKPFLTEKNLMEPLVNYGIKCMSFGFLIEEGSPVIWRGLMVMQALEKLMRQVAWGEVDYLIVDTPPGTGDTHLSLIQNLPINGVVLVTIPQSAALEVTKRGAVMYKKLNIPIIGLVENMSIVKCPSCLKDISVFGEGAQVLADELNIELLEKLPLEPSISAAGNKGVPVVLDLNNDQAVPFKNLAKKIVNFLSVSEIENIELEK